MGRQRVFPYRALRELAKRLFRWNCNVRSSGDKLCGSGLMWPKSGGRGAWVSLHFSGCGLTAFMEKICRISGDFASDF
jgi:hypothetical protein